jgi:hypothetical protein
VVERRIQDADRSPSGARKTVDISNADAER